MFGPIYLHGCFPSLLLRQVGCARSTGILGFQGGTVWSINLHFWLASPNATARLSALDFDYGCLFKGKIPRQGEIPNLY